MSRRKIEACISKVCHLFFSSRRKIEARRSIQGGSLDRAEIQITKTERREMRRSVERLKRGKISEPGDKNI